MLRLFRSKKRKIRSQIESLQLQTLAGEHFLNDTQLDFFQSLQKASRRNGIRMELDVLLTKLSTIEKNKNMGNED